MGGCPAMIPARMPARDFWAGRRVLLTGHTGFKGAWLASWLADLDATVMGISLDELPSDPCLWPLLHATNVQDMRADLARDAWQEPVVSFEPEIVLHLAAQSLVTKGLESPLETFMSNALATARVMDLLPSLESLLVTVVVTTDKVYDARQDTPFCETSFLGGSDPYSASKAASELVVHSWPTDKTVATARAGNVIGGGDWAAHRLLPDLDRAWSAGRALTLRRPRAVRPWQHVLEPLRGYLLYAEDLASGRTRAKSLNFGPSDTQQVAVEDLVAFAAQEWSESTGGLAEWTSLASPPIQETDRLELDSTRAAKELSWTNILDWRVSVTMTIDWHTSLRRGASAHDLVTAQLDSYQSRARGETA